MYSHTIRCSAQPTFPPSTLTDVVSVVLFVSTKVPKCIEARCGKYVLHEPLPTLTHVWQIRPARTPAYPNPCVRATTLDVFGICTRPVRQAASAKRTGLQHVGGSNYNRVAVSHDPDESDLPGVGVPVYTCPLTCPRAHLPAHVPCRNTCGVRKFNVIICLATNERST